LIARTLISKHPETSQLNIENAEIQPNITIFETLSMQLFGD